MSVSTVSGSVVWSDVGFRHHFVFELAADAVGLARALREFDGARRASAAEALADWTGRYADDATADLATESTQLHALCEALASVAGSLEDASALASAEQGRRERAREAFRAEERRRAAERAATEAARAAAASDAVLVGTARTAAVVGGTGQ